MGEQVDIDAAFEALVSSENAALGKFSSASSLPALTYLLTKLNPQLSTTFHASITARRDLLGFMNEFVKYAVDETVMTALAERISATFGMFAHHLLQQHS